MIDEKLQNILTRAVMACDVLFWGCEWLVVGGKRVLRVYIDHANGVFLADCAKVSRQISLVIDAELDLMDNYSLEVSSPGINRQFFEPNQLSGYVGQVIDFHLKNEGDQGEVKVQGQLVELDDLGVKILVQDQVRDVSFDNIVRASLF